VWLGCAQVVHALAVSNNKLGDLHYSRQEHELARSSYSDALAIRQQAYEVQVQGAIKCISAHIYRESGRTRGLFLCTCCTQNLLCG
jgi:hypothetical protein